jgi:hypothetical protein
MPLLPLWAFVACFRVNFTFTFTCYHLSLFFQAKVVKGKVSEHFLPGMHPTLTALAVCEVL